MTHIGVLFDMDGVIIHSYSYHLRAMQIFAEKHGIDIDEKEIMNKYFGRQNKDWMPSLFEKDLSAQQLDDLAEEKEAIYRDIYKDDIEPVPGLINFLMELKEHQVPMAIGTSAPYSNVAFVLEKTNTRQFFEAILDDKKVTLGKPHPEIYLKAADAIKIPPQQCIVIEDSPSGIEAGKRAGAKVIGMATTHAASDLPETDLTVNNFLELNYQKLLDLFLS